MKRWIKVLCIGMFFSLLTGCGKGRGDVASDYQKNAEGGTFEAGEPSNISYQVAGNNNVTFTVDADVTGGERLSGSRCYGVKTQVFDDSYVESKVYPVFDAGTAQSVKPYMVCTDQEMDDRRDALWAEIDKVYEQSASQTDAVSEIWKDGFFADMSELNCSMDTKGQATHTILTGEEKVDPRIPVTATNQKTYSYVDAEGKNICRARVDGEIGGLPYVYETYYQEASDSVENVNWVTLYMRYDRYRKQILARPKEDGDEIPDLGEADAQAVADAFLQKLGYGDFVCCGTEIGAYRERDEDPDTMSANLIDHWYCFSYSRKMDGISAAVTAGVNDLRFGVSGELTAPQETIDVTVDVQGVATVKIQTNQYELEEEGTGITSYLTFEQVDAAAQKYMSEYKQPDYITKNVPQAIIITHVKLNYAYVRYTDGNYNMIPVWAYCGYQFEQNPYQERYSGDASPRECFMFGVSAVDGQIIEGVYSKVVANPFDL